MPPTEPAGDARAPTAEPRSRRIVLVGTTIVVAVLLLGLGAWRLGWLRRAEDPRVVEIGTMMRDLLDKERQRQGAATFFTAVERMSGIAAVGLKVNALPENLRPRIMPLAWGVVMGHLDDRMNAYFSLRTAAERTTFIDGELAQMDFLKRAFESQGGDRAGRPQGASTGASRPPDGVSGGSGQTREQRFTKWVLDRTTPDQRARITEYIAAFERRLAQTGRKRL
jgi:hypothetical protein